MIRVALWCCFFGLYSYPFGYEIVTNTDIWYVLLLLWPIIPVCLYITEQKPSIIAVILTGVQLVGMTLFMVIVIKHPYYDVSFVLCTVSMVLIVINSFKEIN